MLLSMIPEIAIASGGSGTANDPYIITTADELSAIGSGEPGTYYKLGSDITVSRTFKTIESFKGILNGNGKSIRGIDIYTTVTADDSRKLVTATEGALFDTIEKTAVVYNLNLVSPKFSNVFKNIDNAYNGSYDFKRGLLAVTNNGIVDSVKITGADVNAQFNQIVGSVTHSYEVCSFGGILYENNGKLINSYIDGNMKIGDGRLMSGVVSLNNGIIANIQTKMNITVTRWGGFTGATLTNTSCGVGRNYGMIYNLWSEGSVSISSSVTAVKSNSDYNGYITGANEADGSVINCYYKKTSDSCINGAVVGSEGTVQNVIEKSSVDSAVYNANTASSDILGLKKLNETAQPYVVTWSLGSEIVKTELIYNSVAVSLPYGAGDDYYCTGWKDSVNNSVINAPGTYTVTRNVNFTAQNPQGRYYPVFNGQVKLLPDTTTLPEYECKWKRVGSDEFVDAPSEADIATSGGMKKYVAKASGNDVYDRDFAEEYTGKLSTYSKFCVRYIVEENDGKIKGGTFNMYENSGSSLNASFYMVKVSLNAENLSEYIDINIPTDQKYLKNGGYTYPSATAKQDARFVATGKMSFSYKSSGGRTYYADNPPTAPDTYDVMFSMDSDSNFFSVYSLNVGKFTIGKRAVSETVYAFDNPDGYKYGEQVKINFTVKAVLSADGTVGNVTDGKTKLYIDGVEYTGTGSEKNIYGYEQTYTIPSSYISLGDHEYKIEYYDSDYYEDDTFILRNTITKRDPELKVNLDKSECNYGDDIYITVDTPDTDNLVIEDYKDDAETEKYTANIEYDHWESSSGMSVYKYKNPKAGSHYIKVSYKGSTYYDAASKKIVASVKKAKLDASAELNRSEWHYGDNVKVYVTVTDPLGLLDSSKTIDASYNVKLIDKVSGVVIASKTADGSIPSSEFEIDLGGDIPVGEYDVRLEVTPSEDADYDIYTNRVGSLTVLKTDPERNDFNITRPALKYDGSPKPITVTSKYEGMGDIEVLYEDVKAIGTKTNVPPTNAGTYNIYVNVSEGANFNSCTELLVDSVYIAAKDTDSSDFKVTLNSSSERGFVYNGLPVIADVTPAKEGAFNITSVKYYSKDDEGNYTVEESGAPVNPGEYAVKCDSEKSTNYRAAVGVTVCEFEITKAVTSINVSSPVSGDVYTTEDSVKAKGTLSKNGDSAAFPTGTVKADLSWNGVTQSIDGTISSNGEFEIEIPANVYAYTLSVKYPGDEKYSSAASDEIRFSIEKTPVTFTVSGKEYVYSPNTVRNITFSNSTKKLDESDFTVKYYPVDENNGTLESTSAVKSAISAGRYMYVISLTSSASEKYIIQNEYTVSDTGIPDFDSYANVGFMDIKSGAEEAQKPIYFKSGIISKKTTDAPFINPLTNSNASMVLYSSSDDTIASVADDGTVTIHKAGSVTVTAESIKTGATPVYASYTLTVSKEKITISAKDTEITYGDVFTSADVIYPDGMTQADFEGTLLFKTNYAVGKKIGTYDITPYGLTSDIYDIVFEGAALTVNPKVLTAADFTVTASDKVYDGSGNVKLSVSSAIPNIKATAEAEFTDVNAGENKEVRFTLTELTGKDAQNYVLDGGEISGTVFAKIEKAKVNVICAASVTRTYDGSAQSVDVSATANGAVFTEYTVKYMLNGTETEPIEVGVYDIAVESLNANYEIEPFSAALTIKSASQEVFSIENVPETVYYGDKFTVSCDGADGAVSYATDKPNIAEIDSLGNVTVKGTGKVSIIAESKKNGYISRTAVKTVDVKKRILNPTVTALSRVYNGEKEVNVSVLLENTAFSDVVTATATGTMINADAGNGKIVYVNGVLLSDNTNYTLSSQSIQTTVDIAPLDITGFSIKANDKKYDGTTTAQATVTQIDGVLASDIGQVEIVGGASFDSADSADVRTVTFTASSLVGAKAANYNLACSAAYTEAKIERADVTVICASSTVRTYDGSAQGVDVSAMANGAVFTEYAVKYMMNGAEAEPIGVGIYDVVIESLNANYAIAPYAATLTIKSASQEVFSIENVPETVYYGDKFSVSCDGAEGNVTYSTDKPNTIEIDSLGNVTLKGTGKVSIIAESKKDGYISRIAVKTIDVKKRILTPSAIAENRAYNGESGVNVTVSLENTAFSDIVTATAKGSMINSDAGSGKIVYVNGIALSDNESYTLSSQNVQTTVDIAPLDITGFAIEAEDKKYDGTTAAQATVTQIDGVLASDIGQVEIVGSASFDSADSADGKTVVFTANALSGAKAANYSLACASATANAKIEPLKVDFTIGQTTFIYDGADKEISVSASDENGRIFKDFAVSYSATPNAVGEYTAEITLNDEINYIMNLTNPISITITEATQDQLVISGLPGTVSYGDTFTLEAIGGTDGGNLTWSVKSGNASISADGEVEITGIGKIEIEAVKSSDNYSDVSSKIVFTASAKSVSFELGNLEQTYGSVGDITVATDLSADDYRVTYDGSETLPENAGRYKVKVETTNPNYKGYASDTLIINKAAASGDIEIGSSFVYGDKPEASAINYPDGTKAEITYAGTGIYVPRSEAPTNAGSYTAIATISGSNYETFTVTKNFTIEKVPLRVWATNASRAYGESNPIFTLNYEGFKNGDTKDVLLYEPTASAKANASSAVGEYPITVSGGSAENYMFVYDNSGILTVTGASGGQLSITGATNTAYVGQKFTLYAFYGNTKVNASWESSDPDIAAIDKDTGFVTTLKSGTVTFTATADGNYSGAKAEFTINIEKSSVVLSAADTVKTYNGKVQEITLISSNPSFVPVISGEGKNVDVTYTLITDSKVKEPKNAGTYAVSFVITDNSYSGSGNATLYINKANIELKPKDVSKVYGDDVKFELVSSSPLISAEELESLAKDAVFTCDGAAKTAPVKDGGYQINAVLNTNGNDNLNFVISGSGILTVEKAPLTVKVKNVSREYGAENPALEAEYSGFKNGETKDIFGDSLVLAYDSTINAQTPVGTHTGKTTASGLVSDNYEISYVNGDVEITKIPVSAKAGNAKSSYLTVIFDKALAGLTADNFEVIDGDNVITLKSVTASNENKTYTLEGSFDTSVTYTVTVKLTSDTHVLVSEPLSIKPARSGGSGGSGSGGSGGGGGSSTEAKTYTVTFNSNGGSKVSSLKAESGKTVSEPKAPGKDGFEFAGWYSDSGLKTEFDFSSKITKSITLYAKWNKIKVPDTDDGSKDGTESGKDGNPSDSEEWKNPFKDVNSDDWYYKDVEYGVRRGLFSGMSAEEFLPNGNITRAMFVTVLYRASGEPEVAAESKFTDVAKDAYYAKAVAWASENGIVNGISETEFAPDSDITREQTAAIIHRYAKYKNLDVSVGENTNILSFTDYEDMSDYAIAPMQYVVGAGIISGKTAETLNPKDTATRAEIAAVLHRFIEAEK